MELTPYELFSWVKDQNLLIDILKEIDSENLIGAYADAGDKEAKSLPKAKARRQAYVERKLPWYQRYVLEKIKEKDESKIMYFFEAWIKSIASSHEYIILYNEFNEIVPDLVIPLLLDERKEAQAFLMFGVMCLFEKKDDKRFSIEIQKKYREALKNRDAKALVDIAKKFEHVVEAISYEEKIKTVEEAIIELGDALEQAGLNLKESNEFPDDELVEMLETVEKGFEIIKNEIIEVHKNLSKKKVKIKTIDDLRKVLKDIDAIKEKDQIIESLEEVENILMFCKDIHSEDKEADALLDEIRVGAIELLKTVDEAKKKKDQNLLSKIETDIEKHRYLYDYINTEKKLSFKEKKAAFSKIESHFGNDIAFVLTHGDVGVSVKKAKKVQTVSVKKRASVNRETPKKVPTIPPIEKITKEEAVEKPDITEPEEKKQIEKTKQVSKKMEMEKLKEKDIKDVTVGIAEISDYPPSEHSEKDHSEIAELIINNKQPNSSLVNELIWALIEDDRGFNFGLAYCVASYMVNAKLEAQITPFIFETIFRGQSITDNSSANAAHLLKIYQNNIVSLLDKGHPTEIFSITLLLLAQAMRPCLFAPNSGVIEWTKELIGAYDIPAEIKDYILILLKFAEIRQPLAIEILSGHEDLEDQSKSKTAIIRRGKKWLEEAPKRTTQYHVATAVWKYLASNDLERGGLKSFIIPVAEDRTEEASALDEKLNTHNNETEIENFITMAHQRIYGNRRKDKIMYGAKEQLRDKINEVFEIAKTWTTYKRLENINRDNWQVKRLKELKGVLQTQFIITEGYIEQLISENNVRSIRASGKFFNKSIKDLKLVLNGQIYSEEKDVLASIKENINLVFGYQRIKWSLDSFSDTKDLKKLCHFILNKNNWELPLREFLESNYFKDARACLCMFDGEVDLEAKKNELESEVNSKEGEFEVFLTKRIDELVVDVEKAFIENLITDEKRSILLSQVEEANGKVASGGTISIDILKSIDEYIISIRNERVIEVENQYSFVEKELKKSGDEHKKWEPVLDSALEAIKKSDIAVAQEYIEIIRARKSMKIDPNDFLFDKKINEKITEFFPEAFTKIKDKLERGSIAGVAKDITKGKQVAEIKFGELERNRRIEAGKVLDHWSKIKKDKMLDQRGQNIPLTNILNWLGFQLLTPLVIESYGVRTKYQKVKLHADVKGHDVFIPAFGSECNNNYTLLCVWGLPGEDEVLNWLPTSESFGKGTLIFYFGRLSEKRRRDLARISRERGITHVLIDDILLAYLCGERGARLPSMILCGLPFSYNNPYTPYAAGNVPTEMFFGRKEAAQRLVDRRDTCIIYGGRQLGKSALLRYIQRNYHNPKNNYYVCYEDIKNVGDKQGGGVPSELIWGNFLSLLKSEKLIDSKIKSENHQKVESQILKIFSENKNLNVLILFDEADNFLDHDAGNNFREVSRIRRIMDLTERRLKVVFAGLHNVQRFQSIPNQPLAHFGAPIEIGPLEPKHAFDLITKPMRALGYKFENDSLPMKINTYTNYHPSLIQLFCYELNKKLREKSFNYRNNPPFYISDRDIERTFEKSELRQNMKDRFDWTLDLDLRYKVIAYAIAYEYENGNFGPLTPMDIKQKSEDWWKEGFANLAQYHMKGLLEEMAGLGILIKEPDNRYRLRSVNVIQLLGGKQQIEDTLLDISAHEAPRAGLTQTYRRKLGSKQTFSSLTISQEIDIARERSGVCVVCGTDALGIEGLEESIKDIYQGRHEVSDSMFDVSIVIPQNTAPSEFYRWIEKEIKDNKKDKKLFIVDTLINSDSPEIISEQILKTQGLIDKKKGGGITRVIFKFGQQTLANWCGLPRDERILVEEAIDRFVVLERWSDEAIKKWCDDEFPYGGAYKVVSKDTGGWPWLIKYIHEHLDEDKDPRKATRKIKTLLKDSKNGLAEQFVKSLGLKSWLKAKTVLTVARELHQFHDIMEFAEIEDEEEMNNILDYLLYLGCIEDIGDGYKAEPLSSEIVSITLEQ